MVVARRGVLTGVAAAGLARPALAQARPVLRVQCMGGAVERTIREAVIPGFGRAQATEVQLIVEDDVTILPKLQVARSRAPYDVCMMDSDKAILGAAAGLWAPDVSDRLRNIGAIYASCKPPATLLYANIVFEYAMVYRTDRFAQAPESWGALWAPGLTVAVPHVSQAYGLTFLYIAAALNGGSAADLAPGFAAIKRLERIKVYKSVSQGLALFQQKEADAGLFYGHRAQQMIDAGLPVAKTVPKEGIWGIRTGLQIPRSTANLEGAVAWVDAMLGVPAQEAFGRSLYYPTNRDCTFPPELAARLVLGADRVDGIREAPWAEILPQRDAILDRWTREFGS